MMTLSLLTPPRPPRAIRSYPPLRTRNPQPRWPGSCQAPRSSSGSLVENRVGRLRIGWFLRLRLAVFGGARVIRLPRPRGRAVSSQVSPDAHADTDEEVDRDQSRQYLQNRLYPRR